MKVQAVPAFAHTPVEEPMPRDLFLRINGLHGTDDPGVFRLAGVVSKPINHALLSEALGYPLGTMPPDLEDKVCAVVIKHQLIEVLVDRIQMEG